MSVSLRAVVQADLEALFAHESDPDAASMAVVNPRDRDAFIADWCRYLSDPTVMLRAIDVDRRMVGHVTAFESDDRLWVGYWIARSHWGRGIATEAVLLLLAEETRRPLHARVASSNLGSCRVLEKCGFEAIERRVNEATARYPACEEVVYRGAI